MIWLEPDTVNLLKVASDGFSSKLEKVRFQTYVEFNLAFAGLVVLNVSAIL